MSSETSFVSAYLPVFGVKTNEFERFTFMSAVDFVQFMQTHKSDFTQVKTHIRLFEDKIADADGFLSK